MGVNSNYHITPEDAKRLLVNKVLNHIKWHTIK